MLKIAHRGASRYEKENTLAAFKKALDLNADMIELDVRMSKDREILVIHDDKIADLTVSQVREKKWGQDVPTLEQTLSLLKNKCQIDIELKEPQTIEPTVTLVKRLGITNQVLFTCFDHQAIIKLKQKYPQFKTGFIIGWHNRKKIFNLFSLAVKNQINVLVIRHNFISQELIKKAKTNNIKVYIYALGNISKRKIKKLQTLNIDGIMIDY